MLSHSETIALRKRVALHDLGDDGTCACGDVVCNGERFEEHLLEQAFEAGQAMPRQSGARLT